MHRNLELKAHIDSVKTMENIACSLGARSAGVLRQTDTYFAVQNGRLKLREFGKGHLPIPLGPFATHTRVRQAIRRRLAEGLSSPKVARALGCHERTVERERRRMRETPLRQAQDAPLLELMRR